MWVIVLVVPTGFLKKILHFILIILKKKLFPSHFTFGFSFYGFALRKISFSIF